MMRKILLSITAATTLLASPVLAGDIVEAAIGTGNLGMFLKAIRTAGLLDTLKGRGPFTVFAPDDNHAFIEIEDGGYTEFLLDRPRLTATLTYHVVLGKIMSSDLAQGMMERTVEGSEIMITRADDGQVTILGPYQGGPRMNGARIISPDIEASNGVIHVIDTIMRPPEPNLY